MGNREGESHKSYFRAGGRSLLADGRWYFATREGVDVGPYDTREAADAGGARLAAALHGVDDPIAARKIIREFMFLMGTHVRMP